MRCVATAVVLLVSGVAGAQEPQPERVQLAAAGFDFALNTDTGGLAVVDFIDDRVRLYPKFAATRGATPVVSTPVGRTPTAVTFKRYGEKSFFLVTCREAAEIAVLDATTLKLVKAIRTKLGEPVAVVTSPNPKDRFAYYTTSTRAPGKPVEVANGWIDIDTLTDLGRAAKVMNEHTDIVPSADGTAVHFRPGNEGDRLQPYRTLRVPNPNVNDWLADPTIPEGKVDRPGLLADPRGAFVVGGTVVCDRATGKEVARLPFTPLAAAAARPLVFGVTDNRLQAVSTNSFTVAGTAALPAKKDDFKPAAHHDIPYYRSRFTRMYRPRVFEDAAAKAVLVCYGSAVFVVPEAALGLPNEVFLGLRSPTQFECVAGRKSDFALLPEGGSLELVSGPKGLQLGGESLQWTPTADQIGTHAVVVRVSAGRTAKLVKRTVVVRGAAVELPLRPMTVAPNGKILSLAQDGSAAVVVGYGRNPPSLPTVAVLDLVAGKVAATRIVPVRATAAAIDGRFVYVGMEASNSLLVLAAKDLTEVRRIDVGVPVEVITAVADKYVAVTGQGRTTILSVPDFKPATPPGHVAIAPKGDKERAAWDYIPPVWVGDGWWSRGVVFDPTFTKPRAVIDPRDFWTPHQDARPADKGHMDADPPDYRERVNAVRERWFTPWGIMIEKREMFPGRWNAGRLPPGAPGNDRRPVATTVLPDRPAVAVLVVDPRGSTPDDERRSVVEATFVDVMNLPLAKVTLADGPNDVVAPPGPVVLEVRGGKLFAVVGRHVYAVPVPDEVARARVPLRLVPDYPVKVVDTVARTRFPLPTVAGGDGPVKLVLASPPEGLRIDAMANELVFEPAALVRQLVKEVAERSKAESVPDYQKRTAAAFELLAGRKPRGIPIWVPFGAVATSNGKAVEGRYGFFIEIP